MPDQVRDDGVWNVVPIRQSGTRMFFFFSNRAGCLKSLLISAALSLILLALFGYL